MLQWLGCGLGSGLNISSISVQQFRLKPGQGGQKHGYYYAGGGGGLLVD